MKLNTNVQTQAHIFLLTVYKFSLLFALRQQNVVILLSCFSWDVLATHHSFQPTTFLVPDSAARGRTVLPTVCDACLHSSWRQGCHSWARRKGWFLHYSAPRLLLLHLTHKGESVDGSHQILELLLSCSQWWGWKSSSAMSLNCKR